MTVLRVAAAAYLCRQHTHWDDYEAALSGFVAAGAAFGAQVLVLPEYASLELVGLLPAALWNDVQAQRGALQVFLPAVLELHARLSVQHGVYLLAASLIVEAAAGRYVNRAYFFGPDGKHHFQDKLVMTRFEAEEWGIESGEGLKVFDTAHGTLGVNICYDAEFPDFARAQAAAGLDVLLVPASPAICTATSGCGWAAWPAPWKTRSTPFTRRAWPTRRGLRHRDGGGRACRLRAARQRLSGERRGGWGGVRHARLAVLRPRFGPDPRGAAQRPGPQCPRPALGRASGGGRGESAGVLNTPASEYATGL